MATTAEASRAAPEAVYTWRGLDDSVLFRLAAAAEAIALPAVLGNVTSVSNKTVSTCRRTKFDVLVCKQMSQSAWSCLKSLRNETHDQLLAMLWVPAQLQAVSVIKAMWSKLRRNFL